MPRLKNSTPKYRLHKVTGQAVVTLDGRDFYLGPHDSRPSRREYERLVGEWLQNGRSLPSDPHAITVAELINAYRKHAEKYYVKNGKQTDEVKGIKAALRYLRQSYGDKRVVDFGPLSLEVVRQKMIDSGICRGYINQNIGRIKRCFKWGVAKELVPVQIHQALSTVEGLRRGKSEAKETKPVLPVDDSTIDATLPHMPQMIADMVRLQRLTGCRPGELFVLRPCDIDKVGEVWKYVPESHKTEHHGRQRVIHIGPQAQDIIRPYLLRDAKSHCFTRPRGGQFTRWAYLERIHRACDKAFPAPAELDEAESKQWRTRHRWSPNRLRHTAATEIRSKFGLEAAQVTLGHSNANVTQIYAERDLSKAAEIMRQVG